MTHTLLLVSSLILKKSLCNILGGFDDRAAAAYRIMTCGSASFVRTRRDAWDIFLEPSRSTMVPAVEKMSNQKSNKCSCLKG